MGNREELRKVEYNLKYEVQTSDDFNINVDEMVLLVREEA